MASITIEKSRNGTGPNLKINVEAKAVTSPPPNKCSNTSCLYPNPSYAGDSNSGSTTRISNKPVAVIPVDCPKSPIALSNQYVGKIRGAKKNSPNTFQARPTIASNKKGTI